MISYGCCMVLQEYFLEISGVSLTGLSFAFPASA